MSESVCIVNGNVEGVENESGHGEGPPKTAKQLEKEAKKLAKLEKFQQKKDKLKEVPVHTMEKVEVCSVVTGNKSCAIW
jgi:valyl-tRNA synthetase